VLKLTVKDATSFISTIRSFCPHSVLVNFASFSQTQAGTAVSVKREIDINKFFCIYLTSNAQRRLVSK
jgi:hypothetical protein